MGHLRRKASGHILRNAAKHFAASCSGGPADGGFPGCWPCATPIPNNVLVTPSGISLNTHDALTGTTDAESFFTWTASPINVPFCLARAVDCEFRGVFSAGTLTRHLVAAGECVIIDFDVSFSFSVSFGGGGGTTVNVAGGYISLGFVPTRARGYVGYPDDGRGGIFTLDDTAFPIAFGVASGGHCYLFWDTASAGGANSLQDGFGTRTGGLASGEVNSNGVPDQIFVNALTGNTVNCGGAPHDDNLYVAWDNTAIGKSGTITADSSGGC